jgi:hypothetical protein
MTPPYVDKKTDQAVFLSKSPIAGLAAQRFLKITRLCPQICQQKARS